MEVWKQSTKYGGNYEVSTYGNVRSKDKYVEKFCGLHGKVVTQFYKGRMLRLSKSSKLGHLSVHLGHNKEKFTVLVHRFVLETFIGPCPEGMEGCHNNGIASDNRLENLRWDTHENNNKDRITHGTYAAGEKHHAAKVPVFLVDMLQKKQITPIEASKQYGFNYGNLWKIARGEIWSHSFEENSRHWPQSL